MDQQASPFHQYSKTLTTRARHQLISC
jgi:hypothetical protein